MAQTVNMGSPPTSSLSHRKIGAQAAKVPQEVPVATESRQVTINEMTATVRPVTPSFRARLMSDAPTPVAMKLSATA